ncbi:MAG: hypothetical protein FJ164_06100 [Gammaproteobacteria bacterium]|nr:hypothetical protein [Gammaproteobacteria bacterium]
MRGRTRPMLLQLLALQLTLGLAAPAARAAPDTADVIRICRAALAEGYAGEQAAACDWYVRPCGACGAAVVKRWCIPEGVTRQAVAEHVVAGLAAAEPATLTPLEDAVDSLLAKQYPCSHNP